MEVYIGPYLEVPSASQTKTYQRWACTGSMDHIVDCGMKFCPHCGSNCEQRPVSDTHVGMIDLTNLDEWNELVWTPSETDRRPGEPNVWLCNDTRFGFYKDSTEIIEFDEGFLTNLYPMTKYFTDLTEHIVNQVVEQYGVQPIVKYGIILYYN